jgi:molybdopterin converting factor small subunit
MVADTRGKIDLRLYASVKDLLGKDRIDLDWIDNMTAGDVRKKLSESFPILSVVNTQFTISVNRRVVGDRELIQKTDELAILPPISGG